MTWIEERNEDAAHRTREAQMLVGKTIEAASITPHGGEDDCVNLLTLTMADGSVYEVEGSYGGYTGHSCDEYPMLISVEAVTPKGRHAE